VRSRSRDIHRLGVVEDLLPTNPVEGCFDESSLDQIDGVAAQGLQLLAHGQSILDLPVGVLSKCHEHVEIALRPEIVTQNGAEQREFADAPAATEGQQLRAGEELIQSLFHTN